MDIRVPDIGDVDKVPIIELLVAVGDSVAADDPLLVLESDKATMEVPSPTAGEITVLHVKVGDMVGQGDLIAECRGQSEGGDARSSPGQHPPAAAPLAEPRRADSRESQALGPTTITIPDIGTTDKVPVIEILVKPGDMVQTDEPLIVLESDKATMEVPAPQAGRIEEVLVHVGDRLEQGDAVLRLLPFATDESVAGSAPPSAPPSVPATPVVQGAATESPPPSPAHPRSLHSAEAPPPAGRRAVSAAELPHASPSIRRMARELGVDLQQVTGQGRNGRILREDLQQYVQARLQKDPGSSALPEAPSVDYARFGKVTRVPLARIRQRSAEHLHRCWLHVPHVTQTDWADITDLEEFRKQHNAADPDTRLTLLAFLLKACAVLLQRHPDFNSALDTDGMHLLRREYIHIGFAADTDQGLVVPVIRDVDRKSLTSLAAEAAELAASARAGTLKPDQMQGGCFTISSLGGIGGSHFTPIVNSPQVAILGVSRATLQPHWNGTAFVPRLQCPLSLSYDHRVIDGAAAARFTTDLGHLLADVRRLLL